ncbi:toxin HipA [Alphaproteobacteria bacterium]|nr:toxin HipA [Alphaproteobacteria bacterium]
MKIIDQMHVFLNIEGIRHFVGTLAFYNRRYYFEYDNAFLKTGLEISPFALPLKSGVLQEEDRVFDGLFGVFNDSLPDGWGLLLLHRKLKQLGVDLRTLSSLDILSLVGCNGMGALEYEPINHIYSEMCGDYSLDAVCLESEKILEGESSDMLDFILQKNGSSCGARPKVLASLAFTHAELAATSKIAPAYNEVGSDSINASTASTWIIKFQSSMDSKNAGAIEYVYSLAAKKCGIDMPETHLFESKECSGYFGAKRFDRVGDKKLHVHSACGLLNADFRLSSLDYENLMAATKYLTKDAAEVEKMFRIMAFNVKTHNLDDHAKNFSFLMNGKGEWKVAQAYDLTYSAGIHGERMTSVAGKTKDINDDDLLKIAQKCGLSKQVAMTIVEQASDAMPFISKTLKEYGIDDMS